MVEGEAETLIPCARSTSFIAVSIYMIGRVSVPNVLDERLIRRATSRI